MDGFIQLTCIKTKGKAITVLLLPIVNTLHSTVMSYKTHKRHFSKLKPIKIKQSFLKQIMDIFKNTFL